MADKVLFQSPRFVLNTEPPSAAHGAVAAAPRRELRPPFPVIAGCPRSGTSLLAVMLDSHPLLAVPPETAFIGLIASLYGDPAAVRERFFEIVTTDRITVSNWSDFGLDRDALHRRLAAIEPFSVAEGLRAFYALYADSVDKPRCGEKTPGYVFILPQIAALLPEAHFIHVIRDPGDTALSWRKTWFSPGDDFRVLGEGWRKHVEAGRRASRLLPRYVEMRFEDLVLQPERELKRLCEYLALPWDRAMLEYQTQGAARLERLQGRQHARGPMVPRDERTRIHTNLTRAPDSDRVDVWRREMTPQERRALEDAAGPLVRELGYAA
jgi:hypothetical protein